MVETLFEMTEFIEKLWFETSLEHVNVIILLLFGLKFN